MQLGNSLRAPVVFEPTFEIPVQVCPVDDVLLKLGISRVDFIKLDVEGTELSALKGFARLLRGVARPAILVAVRDIRTQPWGYPSREIVEYLKRAGYRWFELNADGSLRPTANDLENYDANLVALPGEREREFRVLVERKTLDLNRGTYSALGESSRRRGIEILKSMVRVRTAAAKIGRPPNAARQLPKPKCRLRGQWNSLGFSVSGNIHAIASDHAGHTGIQRDSLH